MNSAPYGSHHLYFGWNEIYNADNRVDGLHFYTDPYAFDRSFDYIYVHHNLFHDIDRPGLLLSSQMKNAWVWNNIFYDCGRSSDGGGITIAEVVPGSTIHIYNNTFFDNRFGGIEL